MKNNQKGFITVLLILFGVIILAVVGIYLYINKSQILVRQAVTQATLTNSTTQIMSIGTVSSSTISGWNTYTDKRYYFQFDYPANSSIQELPGDTFPIPDILVEPGIDLYATSNLNNIGTYYGTWFKAIQDKDNDNIPYYISTTTIDGETGYEFQEKTDNVLLFIHNEIYYFVYHNTPNLNDDPIGAKIFQTFKFDR